MGREAKSSASPSPRRPARRNHQQQTPTSRQPPRDPMRKRGRASSRPPPWEAMPTPAAGRRASVRGCPCGVRRGDRGGRGGRAGGCSSALCSLLCLNPASGRRVCLCVSVCIFFFFFGLGLGLLRSPRGEVHAGKWALYFIYLSSSGPSWLYRCPLRRPNLILHVILFSFQAIF